MAYQLRFGISGASSSSSLACADRKCARLADWPWPFGEGEIKGLQRERLRQAARERKRETVRERWRERHMGEQRERDWEKHRVNRRWEGRERERDLFSR